MTSWVCKLFSLRSQWHSPYLVLSLEENRQLMKCTRRELDCVCGYFVSGYTHSYRLLLFLFTAAFLNEVAALKEYQNLIDPPPRLGDNHSLSPHWWVQSLHISYSLTFHIYYPVWWVGEARKVNYACNDQKNIDHNSPKHECQSPIRSCIIKQKVFCWCHKITDGQWFTLLEVNSATIDQQTPTWSTLHLILFWSPSRRGAGWWASRGGSIIIGLRCPIRSLVYSPFKMVHQDQPACGEIHLFQSCCLSYAPRAQWAVWEECHSCCMVQGCISLQWLYTVEQM